jgi:hypothetical protein
MEVQIWPLAISQVPFGNRPVTAIYGPCLGGFIQNPATARDQGLAQVENLYVDPVNPATTFASVTCVVIAPGQSYQVPVNFGGDLSVTAASSHHRFSGLVIQAPTDFHRSDAYAKGLVFPPPGPVTVQQTIPSYLYQQYSDDDDLQAFVNAYNTMAQNYVSWMSNINLAVYTGDNISGALLDWVAEGLYGIRRGALSTGHGRTVGPLNTYMMNTLALNTLHNIPPSDYSMTSDDIFKRIITWHFDKGDGKYFDIRWLKRRVERFLTGTDGTQGATNAVPPMFAPDVTYPVSVTFGIGNTVNINLQPNRRTFVKGAVLGTFLMNSVPLNDYEGTLTQFPVSPYAPILKAAIAAGVLELPFQFQFIVNIS